MHMSDALVSPAVIAASGAVSAALLCVAVRKVSRAGAGMQQHIVPLMGVMGAFIFAAQMINFSIPGTGSSGHIVGGILLSAVLGPWAAFITLSSVLVIQCLVFADGGFLALGCNILNMAALSCLVVYPVLFRPLVRQSASDRRLLAVSVLCSVCSALLGALAVTVQTVASGVTALPFGRFLLFMLPIHFLIGAGEGLATGAVLCAVRGYRPELLSGIRRQDSASRSLRPAIVGIALTALVLGGVFSWVASSKPDGLEFSIERASLGAPPELRSDGIYTLADGIQRRTALMPDYDTSAAGIVGSGAILAVVFGASFLVRFIGRRL